jgi:hypothetical protein
VPLDQSAPRQPAGKDQKYSFIKVRATTGGTEELGRPTRPVITARDMEARYRCRPLQPDCWHGTRHAADLDEDSIGILAVPPPSLDALGDQLRTHFGFLADLDATEQRIVAGGAGSRNLVLEAIGSLPGSRFAGRPLY